MENLLSLSGSRIMISTWKCHLIWIYYNYTNYLQNAAGVPSLAAIAGSLRGRGEHLRKDRCYKPPQNSVQDRPPSRPQSHQLSGVPI